MTTMTRRTALLSACLLVVCSHSFVPQERRAVRTALFNVGGWGIGPQRDISPEEFARGDRRAFEGYKMTDRGEFMRKIKEDRDEMMKSELDELLGVAAQAGIKVKDPAERLNKFSPADLVEDDDLDLSVQWDEEEMDGSSREDSITRMDEDTGAPGVW